jgi:cytosine/adenosine deaminase-related metal-dependent hydrolase
MMVVRAAAVWFPGRVERDQVITVDDDGIIIGIRAANSSDPEALQGMVIPGLINAHLHLELSWMHEGVLSQRGGIIDWLERQLHYRSQIPDLARQQDIARRRAQEMFELGTAGVFDISNLNWTAPLIAAAGLSGVVQHELLTMDRQRLRLVLERVNDKREDAINDGSRVVVRPGPHALYSTAPQLVRASSERRPEVPFSIHISESPEEDEFVASGQGPFAQLMKDLGVDWDWWEPVGMSPVAYLDALGLLGSRSLLVHGVSLSGPDFQFIADRLATLCLCPRSNRWIGGVLPDVLACVEAGIRLCVGTDSLASNSSLDVMEEVVELGQAFPGLPMETWLSAVTENGAAVLANPWLGRIELGCSPGLLWLADTPAPESLRAGLPPRREWLVKPRGYHG